MKATSFSSSVSANLGKQFTFGQAMKKRPTGHTIMARKFMAATLSYFSSCELVEGRGGELYRR